MVLDLLTELNYEDYSLVPDVQRMAKEAISHTSKIYSIYIMCKYHAGQELDNNQILFLDAIIELIDKHDVDVTLVCNEQDLNIYLEYNKENDFKIKLLSHSCYDSNTDLSNNRSKIRNFILKTASSRFGNKNIDWLYMIDEGVIFKRVSNNKNGVISFTNCLSADSLLITLSIWQYYTTKFVRQSMNDENQIGMTGFSSYYNLCDNKEQMRVDKSILNNAILINMSECNRKHIDFEQMIDVFETIDFNFTIASNGLHSVLLAYPICVDQTLKETWNQRKQNNMNLNLWAKWGDKVVKEFKIENNLIVPIFIDDFSSIIKEYNSSNKHRMTWPKNDQMYSEYLTQKKKILS